MSLRRNIIMLRKRFNCSQEEIASKLGVTRQTYAKFENGSGDLNSSQIQQLANIFGVTISELYYEIKDTTKFKQMFMYILSKFSEHGLPKTKLAKLLYLCDFNYYYNYLSSISNVDYKCKEYGPLAEPFLETIDDMAQKGELHIDILDGGAQILTLSKSVLIKDFALLDDEKQIIDKICKKWKNANSQELVNFTHNQKPWMACREGEIIPYDLILQEDPNCVF